MDNFELNYKEWLRNQEESSASTRARREIALGLRTATGMGSLHGHSTAYPWEVRSISKKIKKGKKKVEKSPDAPKVDTWLQELEALGNSVKKLRDILDKKKKSPKPVTKSPAKKEEPKDKEKPESPQPGEVKSDKEQWQTSKKKPENSKEV